MTHTLHRRGNIDELKQDYVVLAIGAKGYNREGAASKMTRILKMMASHNPVMYGYPMVGNSLTTDLETLMKQGGDNGGAHAVFSNEEDLVALLKDLKKEDLGISIVVSGLFEGVSECCHKAGLEPHTVNTSMGVWGKTELLPSEPVLEIGTMCGHGMVSFSLIEKMAADVKKGAISPRKAAERLGRTCICGIFNLERAEKILIKMAEIEE